MIWENDNLVNWIVCSTIYPFCMELSIRILYYEHFWKCVVFSVLRTKKYPWDCGVNKKWRAKWSLTTRWIPQYHNGDILAPYFFVPSSGNVCRMTVVIQASNTHYKVVRLFIINHFYFISFLPLFYCWSRYYYLLDFLLFRLNKDNHHTIRHHYVSCQQEFEKTVLDEQNEQHGVCWCSRTSISIDCVAYWMEEIWFSSANNSNGIIIKAL